MRTYDACFPRYALRNRLMIFCRLFSPVVGGGISVLSTFLACSTKRVNRITGKTMNLVFSSIFCLIRAKNISRVLMFAHRISDVI